MHCLWIFIVYHYASFSIFCLDFFSLNYLLPFFFVFFFAIVWIFLFGCMWFFLGSNIDITVVSKCLNNRLLTITINSDRCGRCVCLCVCVYLECQFDHVTDTIFIWWLFTICMLINGTTSSSINYRFYICLFLSFFHFA